MFSVVFFSPAAQKLSDASFVQRGFAVSSSGFNSALRSRQECEVVFEIRVVPWTTLNSIQTCSLSNTLHESKCVRREQHQLMFVCKCLDLVRITEVFVDTRRSALLQTSSITR